MSGIMAWNVEGSGVRSGSAESSDDEREHAGYAGGKWICGGFGYYCRLGHDEIVDVKAERGSRAVVRGIGGAEVPVPDETVCVRKGDVVGRDDAADFGAVDPKTERVGAAGEVDLEGVPVVEDEACGPGYGYGGGRIEGADDVPPGDG